MSLINISNLTFAYEGSYDNIFENVSFRIDTDWKLGFIGRNGKGKTTFLKLLLGKHEYGGRIDAAVKFQYFPYDVVDKGRVTGDVVREVCPAYNEWELMREISLLDVGQDVVNRPFNTLSNGEQTKVLLAALLLDDNNFLLIDEPTNHLDVAGREAVGRYLNSKRGFILVSHDRALLNGCIDHVLSINRASIEVQRGNFASWMANKERQDNFELAENAKLKKEIKRLNQAARQSKDWADKVESTKIGTGAGLGRSYIGEKSRRMQQRRKNLERRQQSAVEDKSKLLKDLERPEALKLIQPPYHKPLLLSLSDVSIFYGDKRVCDNISFDIRRGERVALKGRNGAGKSSILKLLCSDKPPHTGEVSVGGGLQISYVPQDTSFLQGSLTDYAMQNGINESLFKAVLRKLDFARVQFEKDMKDFSSGQKKKTLIAHSLCKQAHLLIWDEALNFIDVLSRIQIEELLLEHRPTMLFVEHDSVFCDRIATKSIQL